MAANFWTSSHYEKLLTPKDVGQMSPIDQERGLTAEDVKLLKQNFSKLITHFAIAFEVRQRVAATAITYFRRLYVKKSFIEYRPEIVAAACFYLASKTQECELRLTSVVNFTNRLARHFREDARRLNPSGVNKFYLWKLVKGSDNTEEEEKDKDQRFEFTMATSKSISNHQFRRMECLVLEALDFSLYVYHPYRPMVQILEDAGMSAKIQRVWSIINDSYQTDLILVYPPFMIAIACIYLQCIIDDQEKESKGTEKWLETLNVDKGEIRKITMKLLDFYENDRAIPLEKVSLALEKIPWPAEPIEGE